MITFHAQQTIARPPDEVFAFAADFTQHPRWMAVTESEPLTSGVIEPGARARQVMKLGPARLGYEIEVSDATPGRRIAWRVGRGSLWAAVALDLEPEGDSTRVTYSGSMGLTGAWRLIEPIIAAEARRGEARELLRLKEILERGSTPNPAGSNS